MNTTLRHLFCVLLLLFVGFTTAKAQDTALANEYFFNGEYEKAAQLYENLYKNEPTNDYYFNRYLECLTNLDKYAEAETLLKKEIKNRPREAQLWVAYGRIADRQGNKEEADDRYKQAIQKMPADNVIVIKVANAFTELTKYDYAIKAYERGGDLVKESRPSYAYNLADLYRRKGDMPKMISEYLNTLDGSANRLMMVKSMFQRSLTEGDYENLQAQLYERVQDNPDDMQYPELLSWLFLQRKDYTNALRQAKAMDKRLQEQGQRVFQLANIAANDKDYDAAIQAYQYLVDKGASNLHYLDARREVIACRQRKVTEGYGYNQQDLTTLATAYEQFLNEFGWSANTARVVKDYADFEALYNNQLDKAIKMLSDMLVYPGLDPRLQSLAKLSLGDYYLIKDEIWEATLLYSQVDKQYKEDQLGEEARYRNAQLSYYNGDFQWAQSQFDVLKIATSRVISNDAIDKSVFIMDNLNLDTIATPLELYAKAELLVYQNKFDQAFATLDTLRRDYPGHKLDDDILYLKAQLFKKMKNYTAAAEMYQLVIDNYATEGVRADNSLFELAQLYEYQLQDVEKAKTLYEKLFVDFSNSTFAVDARRKFRQLRGDKVVQ